MRKNSKTRTYVIGQSSSGLAAGFEELGEALEGAFAGVVDDLVGAGGEELDGGEGLDLDVFDFVGGRVHLGDDDALVILVLLTQLVPGRRQLFAVAAPRGV